MATILVERRGREMHIWQEPGPDDDEPRRLGVVFRSEWRPRTHPWCVPLGYLGENEGGYGYLLFRTRRAAIEHLVERNAAANVLA